jgi:hypothetical protein
MGIYETTLKGCLAVNGKTLRINAYAHVLPASGKPAIYTLCSQAVPGPGFEGEQEVPTIIGR